MKNDATHNCLDTMGRKSGENLGLSYGHGLGGNQANTKMKNMQIMREVNCFIYPGVRLHQASAGDVWRQLPWRRLRRRASQAGQVPRDGREPGLELERARGQV